MKPRNLVLPEEQEANSKISALRKRINQLEPMIASTEAQLLTIEKIVQERL
jgi:hypothetical protein